MMAGVTSVGPSQENPPNASRKFDDARRSW